MARLITKYGFLDPKKSLFMLCDIQEKFRPGMKYFDAMVNNSKKLVAAGKILEIPLIVTEHYPEKLGNIVKDLNVSHADGIFKKTYFSMTTPEVNAKIEEIAKKIKLETIILFGLEAHICMALTAMNLREMGYTVHVVADCSMSRSLEDRALAFDRLKELGCFITTSESVIFNLMKDKNHPKFDQVRKLVTHVSEPTELCKL